MKIVQLLPGFGSRFYCQNCFRDQTYVRHLMAQGHQVSMIPLYLPWDNLQPGTPLFYNAIVVYLQQRWSWTQKLPKWFLNLFNLPLFIKLASSMSGSTRADGMEDLTISMLRGEQGKQSGLLNEVLEWIKNQEKPDIIHLSNALLLGLAPRLRRELKTPLVCSLQDEDQWIQSMAPSYQEQVWQLISEKASFIDLFVTPSNYYAEFMARHAGIERNRNRIVHLGVETRLYHPAENLPDPPVIGYLSRMNESLGLDLLVKAFIILKKSSQHRDIRLAVCGGYTKHDVPFINQMKQLISQMGLAKDVKFCENYSSADHPDFLRSVSILTVPVKRGEAFGTYQIEAMATGVPVVQPDVGAFAEIISQTGGGITYEPNTPACLAHALATLLLDRNRAAQIGSIGRKHVLEHFDISNTAQSLLAVYSEALNSRLTA